mmetsp:Transcript_43096/g.100589  ORF Transcript_43096/g.100589 Transcript_43096/m.100589 type:complete len:224 (+) Transcript_43096:571-1242(+)
MKLQNVLHSLQLHVADDDILVHLLRKRLVRLDVRLPADPVFGFRLVNEIIAVALIREADRLRQPLHVGVEALAVVHSFVICNGATDGPHHGIAEQGIIAHFLIFWTHRAQRLHVFFRVVVQKRVDEASKTVDEAHVQHGTRKVEGLANGLDVGFEIIGEVQVESSLWYLVHLLSPALNIRFPTDVCLVDEQHAATRNCCRTRMLHVLNFQNHAHGRCERNSLV